MYVVLMFSFYGSCMDQAIGVGHFMHVCNCCLQNGKTAFDLARTETIKDYLKQFSPPAGVCAPFFGTV
jgi:hypothetical protein